MAFRKPTGGRSWVSTAHPQQGTTASVLLPESPARLQGRHPLEHPLLLPHPQFSLIENGVPVPAYSPTCAYG